MLAAGSSLLRGVTRGPSQPARVIASFDHAVYLDVPGAATVLPVLDREALALPTGVLLGNPLAPTERPTIGAPASVGHGSITWPGVHIDVVREWRPAPVRRSRHEPDRSSRPDADRGNRLRSTLARLDPPVTPGLTERLAGVLERLPDAARGLSQDTVRLAEATARVVGFGPGLTPSGDDALCGALLTMRARGDRGDSAASVLWDAVEANLHRTTTLSASLLRAANSGHAVPSVVRLVNAITSADVDDVCGTDESAYAPMLFDVLVIGHSSGRDLVTGMSLVLSSPVITPEGACLV